MTPSNGPDLAALREKAEAVIEHPSAATVREWWDERENLSAESLLAVLAENERLREYVDAAEKYFKVAWTRQEAGCLKRLNAARDALAGSPAANEEQQT